MSDSAALDWASLPEIGRGKSIAQTARRLAETAPPEPVIIETGTLRNESPRGRHGDGWSSLARAWFAAQTGETFHSADIDTDCLDACRRVTAEYAEHVQYHYADSLE